MSSIIIRRLKHASIINKRSVCNSFPSVAINGFGRIGKCLLRKSFEKGVNVVAVNQPFVDIKAIGNALKYDTVHGQFKQRVEEFGNFLCIGGNHLKIIHEENPDKIKWKDLGVDYVIDSSGKFTEKENAMKHIKAGASKVIITTPTKEIPMFVKGVNFEGYQKSMQIVSNSSCTTNCAAPIIKAIHQKFCVNNCLLTTTHAMTASQHVHDGLYYRAASDNIVPSTTGAAIAIGMIIPELKNLVKGDATRVPVLDVSILKLYMNVKQKVTVDDIKEVIKCRAQTDLKDILNYTDQKFISSDFIGCQHSAVVDLNQISVIDNLITIGAWYDNEMGYSCRVLDLVKHMIEVDNRK